MKNRPELIALVLLVILSFFLAAQSVFIMPVFASMLASLGVAVSLPSRIALGMSQNGIAVVCVFVVALVLALRRVQPAGDRGRQAQVLNIASIVVAIALLLQAAVYVDFARVAGRVMGGRSQTASVQVMGR